jgi:hypothetical protein
MNDGDDGPEGADDPRADDRGTAGTPRMFDRRAALMKAGVGAGVVGLVWSSPRIEGLSLRPDYAQAASTAGSDEPFTVGDGGTPNPYSLSRAGSPNLQYGYSTDNFGDTDFRGFHDTGVTEFQVAATSDCPTLIDVAFDPISNVGPPLTFDRTDSSADSPPGLAYSRLATYSFSRVVSPNVITFHFTC